MHLVSDQGKISKAIRKEIETSGEPGKTIAKIMKSRGMTYRELGDKIGVSYQQIGKYVSGQYRISVAMLYSIAEALEVDVRGLLPGRGNFSLKYFLKQYRDKTN